MKKAPAKKNTSKKGTSKKSTKKKVKVGAKAKGTRTSRVGVGGLAKSRSGERSDWRVEMLARVREIIRQADPEAVEEVKWRKPSNGMAGVPVWSHGGMICTGETYKNSVKLTFAKGASLDDPSGLFNASLDGGTRRAIDLHEGDRVNERAFKALIRAAVALNTAQDVKKARAKR